MIFFSNKVSSLRVFFSSIRIELIRIQSMHPFLIPILTFSYCIKFWHIFS